MYETLTNLVLLRIPEALSCEEIEVELGRCFKPVKFRDFSCSRDWHGNVINCSTRKGIVWVAIFCHFGNYIFSIGGFKRKVCIKSKNCRELGQVKEISTTNDNKLYVLDSKTNR